MNYCAVILARESSSRRWPVRRELYPKPLIAMFAANSLPGDAATWLDRISAVAKPLDVCHEER